MVQAGEVVVYGRDVCKVLGVIEKYRDDEDYYKFSPLTGEMMTIHVPVARAEKLLRPVISRKQTKELIKKIPTIEPVAIEDRMLESTYRDLVHSGNHEDLIRIIKTAYLRNEDKLNKGLKRSEKDKTYFRMAEKILYSELAVALEKTYDETKAYIVDQVNQLDSQLHVATQYTVNPSLN